MVLNLDVKLLDYTNFYFFIFKFFAVDKVLLIVVLEALYNAIYLEKSKGW